MRGSEVRKKFLDFFKEHGHTVLLSSSLVPSHDPTLLFTNAGMVQFKDIFTGKLQRPYTRATTCQKCVRAGGKHNDLENVGRTARHHTFFEMLGNFSFGDYFKREAIQMAWEFLTKELALPKDRLWVTVFTEDDEAARFWEKGIGIPYDRIVKMGEKDNFWAMGDTGPCGPCSEIVIDQGDEFSCGAPGCLVGCDCDRYLELWNLVFMQFERNNDGKLVPLPKPSIDTGMGLERIAAVLQGGKSNYDSDLFTPIVKAIEKETGMNYGLNHKSDVSFRVISDHIRAITFLLADGVLPSNEGRGYVLRRIIRRAARHGKLLNLDKPFLCRLVSNVADVMEGCYPELQENLSYISSITGQEEERFQYALDRGLNLLSEIMEAAKNEESPGKISGEAIFRLYDTYGFPLDLTQEILAEQGMDFDKDGFEKAMERQREKARKHWLGSGEKGVKEIYKELASRLPETRFLGYETTNCEGNLLAIICGQELVNDAKEGMEVEMILDQTSFYGEKGGQRGDTGIIKGELATADVTDTISAGGLTIHKARIKRGIFKVPEIVYAEVDKEKRMRIALNHTATHLLHSALRYVLGDHVRQAGSLVAEDRLRFDFTHFSPLTKKDIERIEDMVNARIREDIAVSKEEMKYQEALNSGAIALFGEKYQERVRVVNISDFSSELCGGTHCESTGQIGLLIINSETGVAAGVRRIEAITGKTAFSYVQDQRQRLARIAGILKTPEMQIEAKMEDLLLQVKELEKTLKEIKTKFTRIEIDSIFENSEEAGGIRFVAYRPSEAVMDMDSLRQMADMVSDRLGSGIVVLAAEKNAKANIIVKISKDLTGRLNAAELIRRIAVHVGGSGGGRPDMAQAGGSNLEGIDNALASVPEAIESLLT